MHSTRWSLGTVFVLCGLFIPALAQSTRAQPPLFTAKQFAPDVWAAIADWNGPSLKRVGAC